MTNSSGGGAGGGVPPTGPARPVIATAMANNGFDDGPPAVFAEAVPVFADGAALPPAPDAPSPDGAPPLNRIVASLRRELGVAGTVAQVVDQACQHLGVDGANRSLLERARACWDTLHGAASGAPASAPPPPPRSRSMTPERSRSASSSGGRFWCQSSGAAAAAAPWASGQGAPRAAGQMPLQYDLAVGDLVVAATAWKRVMVGDRGVVVGPCEDSSEKAPHKRCRIKFDDGKGTYVYTKGQQARRAPILGGHVLGDCVLATAARPRKFNVGDRGVVVGRGRSRSLRDALLVRFPNGVEAEVSAGADVRAAPVVVVPGAPAILKGDVVLASVDYEAITVGDRGVVVGPCSDPAMSRADLRVLVDFENKTAYNYRCDTQLQLAPLLEGTNFVRGDEVVVGPALGKKVRGVVLGLGRRAGALAVDVADGAPAKDVPLGHLKHAPLVAGAPHFAKGTRVVAKVAYNAVRVGDRGVVVGPCNVLTMPNAAKRVLVDFGRKGLYNYAVDTQLTSVHGDEADATDGAFDCGAGVDLPWGLSSRLPAIFAAVCGPWSQAILDEDAQSDD